MTRKLFTLLIMFLTMVGNAVWAEGSGTEQDPYTGEITTAITPTEGGTVYLENATITNSDYIMNLENFTGNFTIHISGVCELGTPESSQAALYFPNVNGNKEQRTLTIEGNGILRIFGVEGSGSGKKTGDFIINNSTVYFLGNIGNDNSGNHGSITIDDGIVFLEGTVKGDATVDLEQGIFFTHQDNTWDGTVKTKGEDPFIINSTISGDIDGDGTVEDDENVHLTIEAPSKVQLGDGVAIERDNNQFQVEVENGAVFKYFMAQYDQNKVNNNDVITGNSTDYTYYGTNAYIDLAGDLTCGGSATTGVHEFLGWVDGEDDMHSASKRLEDATPATYTNPNINGAEYVNFSAAWATRTLNIGVRENEAMQDRALANTPDGTVSYTSDDLSSFLPNSIEFKDGTFSGTAEAGTASAKPNGVYEVTVPYTYMKDGSTQNGAATVTITVTANTPDINSGTIEFVNNTGEWYYSGNARTQNIQIKIDENTTLVEGVDFTVTYEYDPEVDGTTSVDGDKVVVKNAGTYIIKKITAVPGKAQGTEISDPKGDNQQPLIVTIKQRTLNIQAVNQTKEIDDSKSFNKTAIVYSNATNSGTVYVMDDTRDDNDYFVSNEQSVTDIFTGTLSADGYNEASPAIGTYTISCENLALKDATPFLANNYTLGTKTAGTLTVTDALSDDDVETEIKDEDDDDENKPTEDENGAWTIIYDGKSHEITTVKKGETVIPAQDGSGKANYSISYSYQATAESGSTDLEEGDEIKNVGTYTATITFTNGYTGTKTQTIIIKPRDLTVDLNIPETIEPEQDLDNLSDWWNKEMIELNGIVTDEETDAKASFESASVSIKDPLTSGEPVDVVVKNVKLEDKDSFLTSNYNITYKNGETTTISNWEDLDDTPNDGDENDTTIDDGTTVGKIEIDPSEDGDDITGGEDNTDPKDYDLDDTEDFVMIVPDGEGEISVYDGNTHELSLLIIKTDNGTYTLKETEDYTVSYTSNDSDIKLKDSKPFHAGKYTATITLNDDSKYQIGDGSSKEFTLTIEIAQRPLTVDLNIPTTIKSGQDLDNLSDWWSNKDITFENIVADEEDEARATLATAAAQITGPLPAAGEKVTVTATDVKLTTDSDPFFVDNYDITYKNGETTLTLTDTDSDSNNDDTTIDDGTTVDDSDKIKIDPDDEDTDITGGENEDGEEGLDEDDYILVSTGNSDDINAIYDGETHTIEYMVATVNGTTYYLTAGTDFTVGFNNSEEGLEEGKPHDAGTYKATIEMTGKYKGSFTLDVTIKPRPLTVYFNFPQEIADKANIEWNKNHITYNGLVNADEEDEETPMIPDGCRLEVRNNKVWLLNFALNDNVDTEFEKDNYVISYQGNTGDITVLINSAEEDIDEDGNPDTELPDGEIDLNPGDHNKPDGGNHGSGWDKPEYYNIYQDTICPGIHIELSKDVVQEGHQVSVYLTIQSECDTTGMRFEYKRGLFGWWDDLKVQEGTQPGEYIIKNIYTDIYIRALDATMPDDATGLEEVEGVKAYAQDGNIYVYTPNRMPVWIVSMTGAVLRNEEQVGLQAYDRLTRGIYIVRVGEQVFKIRL